MIFTVSSDNFLLVYQILLRINNFFLLLCFPNYQLNYKDYFLENSIFSVVKNGKQLCIDFLLIGKRKIHLSISFCHKRMSIAPIYSFSYFQNMGVYVFL